jgi:hypothetical protein
MAATKQATLALQQCPICESGLSIEVDGKRSCGACGLLYGFGDDWDGEGKYSGLVVLEVEPETTVQKCRAGAGSECFHLLDPYDRPICPRVDRKPRRQVPKNTLFNEFEVCKFCANQTSMSVFDRRDE